MKKWIALMLALVLVLGMVGCGGTSYTPEPTAKPTARPTPEPTPTPEPKKITESKACRIAENSVKELSGLLAKNVYNCAEIDLFTIGSSSATYLEAQEKYKVTVKGHFWSVDEYGNTGHKYNFSWEMNIDAYETDDTAILEAYAGNRNVKRA